MNFRRHGGSFLVLIFTFDQREAPPTVHEWCHVFTSAHPEVGYKSQTGKGGSLVCIGPRKLLPRGGFRREFNVQKCFPVCTVLIPGRCVPTRSVYISVHILYMHNTLHDKHCLLHTCLLLPKFYWSIFNHWWNKCTTRFNLLFIQNIVWIKLSDLMEDFWFSFV